ncbi:MAG: hypothetical protein ACRDSJ_15425 [Rubrobacteraceae bacterium]
MNWLGEMQRIALVFPVVEGHQAQDGKYFRCYDLEHAVGLTADLRCMKIEMQDGSVEVEGPYCEDCVFAATAELDVAGHRVLETARIQLVQGDEPWFGGTDDEEDERSRE